MSMSEDAEHFLSTFLFISFPTCGTEPLQATTTWCKTNVVFEPKNEKWVQSPGLPFTNGMILSNSFLHLSM